MAAKQLYNKDTYKVASEKLSAVCVCVCVCACVNESDKGLSQTRVNQTLINHFFDMPLGGHTPCVKGIGHLKRKILSFTHIRTHFYFFSFTLDRSSFKSRRLSS